MQMKLTDKQEKFALNVGLKGMTQAAAYVDAYDAGQLLPDVAAKRGQGVAANMKVATRINTLREEQSRLAVQDFSMSVKELMNTYIQIFLTDPNELISMRVGCCRYCWGRGGGYQWRDREYMDELARVEKANERLPVEKHQPLPAPQGGFGFNLALDPNPECLECSGEGVMRVVPKDTTKLSPGALHLYRGVKVTKDGVQVLFGDKEKALENIGRMLGAFNDKVRVDITGKLAELRLTTNDPNEAAAAYQKMVAAFST